MLKYLLRTAPQKPGDHLFSIRVGQPVTIFTGSLFESKIRSEVSFCRASWARSYIPTRLHVLWISYSRSVICHSKSAKITTAGGRLFFSERVKHLYWNCKVISPLNTSDDRRILLQTLCICLFPWKSGILWDHQHICCHVCCYVC